MSSAGTGAGAGSVLQSNKNGSPWSGAAHGARLLLMTFMLIQFNAPTVDALRCYACGLTQSSGDPRCVTEPQSVEGQSVVTCSRKYCTITRQELVDPPGKLVTFLRGCEENPLYLDEVLEDPTFITYYRSCTTDLCNAGDGLGSSGSALTGLNEGASENLLVPGLAGNAAPIPSLELALLIKITSLSLLSAARIFA